MNIVESLHRILGERDTLADLFYQHFLVRYPEVATHFQGVNLRRQAMLLTMALMVMERHHSGNYPATAMYLRYLGSKHHVRGVPEHLYPQFREALLAVLERFHDKDWGPELATQWGAAIDRTTATMLEGYKDMLSV
jgi:hemoglobin-like flavoprotein